MVHTKSWVDCSADDTAADDDDRDALAALRRAAGGQSPLNLDLAIRQRQAAHQALLLLEIQPTEIAVVLLGDAGCLKNIVFQFLLSPAGVQHQKSDEEHPLVLALQFLQKSLGISAVGRQIRRK